MNEVSFRARPHHNVHTGSKHISYWPSMEGGLYKKGIEKGGERVEA
jgi:hypothetical protein